jgi:hypothetical protein
MPIKIAKDFTGFNVGWLCVGARSGDASLSTGI